jgi:predicted TIM-barrel fold metal-dependent hydrolase
METDAPASPVLNPTSRGDLWRGAIVDVDIHAVVPGLEALRPYLDEVWLQYIDERNWTAPPTASIYPPNLDATARPEWRPEDGRPPASAVEMIRADLLDPFDIEYGILNCVYAIDGGPPDFSTALARAVNDWLIAEWLEADPRLRASIVLPTRDDPAAIAAEIDRVGGHPGFVQALLPARSGGMYGKRLYWPVFEAIARNDLVAGIHWGGSNNGLPPTPSGWPSTYIEEYVGEVQVFESQLISLLAEGTFQRFPELRVTFLEIGFTWVPMWMWDLDRNWKGMRREVPWLKRPPFEILREHVRFSTAPLDAPSAEELAPVITWLGPQNLLLFASDYPHMHDDDLATLLGALPEESRSEVMADSAREWYRLGSV